MFKKKFAATALALSVFASSFTACSDEAVVISFRDTVITQNEYIYLLSTYKAEFLEGQGFSQDLPELWNTEIQNDVTDVTYGDFCSALFTDQVMTRAIFLQLFDEYGLSLTSEQKKAVDDWGDEWIRYMGSKSALNSQLSIYGIDVKMLKEIKLDDLKVSAVKQYLFGENGIMQPTDEDVDRCYRETYYRTKFIRLSKTKEFDFGEDGKPIYDETSYAFSVHDITTEEYEQKQLLYSELQERLNNGEDFESLMYEYTMESRMVYFGQYYFNASSGIMENALKEAVSKAEIGKWIAVETETDWYIAMRYELEDKPYLDSELLNNMFTTLASDTLTMVETEFIASQNEDIEWDSEVMNIFPFAAMTPNFMFK